jgi:nucleoside-diphosphate-sugar epimerase
MENYTAAFYARSVAAALFAIGVAYLWRLNKVMGQTPPEAVHASPYRWADHEIKDTYKRIKAKPIDWTKHLPPKANRRYVITGGSGGVGGQIVLHLLSRGESPESIRIVDFRQVERADMKTGVAAKVGFAQADITSPSATQAAFDKPWPSSVAKLPLTVFHTAALIIPGERTMGTYEQIKRVNIEGTQNVLNAAKAAGTTIFIATSSGSIAHTPAGYWGNPFRRWPRGYFQVIDESDFDKPLRPHSQFFANYAHTKAVAERIVCKANSPNFRTGTIRPANAIYGSSNGDVVVGKYFQSFRSSYKQDSCMHEAFGFHRSIFVTPSSKFVTGVSRLRLTAHRYGITYSEHSELDAQYCSELCARWSHLTRPLAIRSGPATRGDAKVRRQAFRDY